MPPNALPNSLLMTNSIHLPGLNGLRAIAALSVMWGHVFQKDFGNWGTSGFSLPVVADGVTLFFVISGFLITYLLLNEQKTSSDISIPKFYMRRILRIWPIYYVYMIIALWVTGTWHDSNIWYYGFFAANIPFIITAGIWPIVHYWSIGVEEQFYLFWPWVVKLTKGKYGRLLAVAATLCGIWLVCKWGVYVACGPNTLYRFFAATRFDCMMIGALGAILYFKGNTLFMKTVGNRWVGLICLTALAFSTPWMGCVPAPVRPQVLALLSLAAIMSQLIDNPVVSLENRVCDTVGKISYGIYVIHPLMIFLLSGLWRNAGLQISSFWDGVIIYIGMTLSVCAIAWLSYRYFERPFLKMKDRFTIVRSQSSMQR